MEKDVDAAGALSVASPLLYLPTDIMVARVLSRLSTASREAMRQSSRLCRAWANVATACVRLSPADAPHLQRLQLHSSFPNCQELRISNAAAASTPAAGSGSAPGAARWDMPQLVFLVQACAPQLHLLRSLDLDLVDRNGRSTSADMAPLMVATAEKLPALTRLALRGARLEDAAVEAVGRLTRLQALRLLSTGAVTHAPLASLASLQDAELTVTPPVAAALAPLAGMPLLRRLCLRGISPARGWGSALRCDLGRLPGLQDLSLLFCSLSDEDLEPLHLATGLTRLDLRSSRHLSVACVPHLALPRLQALHIEDTGLILGPRELHLLGSCPLNELHTDWLDLKGVDPPPSESGLPLAGSAGVAAALAQPWACVATAVAAEATEGRGAPPPPGPLPHPLGWPLLTHLVLQQTPARASLVALLSLWRLESLSLSRVRLEDLAGAAAAAAGGAGGAAMRQLRLSGIALGGVGSADALRQLPDAFPALTALALEQCSGVAPSVLAALTALPRLECLEVAACPDVTCAGVALLARRLARLHVRGCAQLGPTAAAEVRAVLRQQGGGGWDAGQEGGAAMEVVVAAA